MKGRNSETQGLLLFFPSFLRDQILLVKNLILQSDTILDKTLQTCGNKNRAAKWHERKRFLLLNFFQMRMPQVCRNLLPALQELWQDVLRCFTRDFNTSWSTSEGESGQQSTWQLFSVKFTPKSSEELLSHQPHSHNSTGGTGRLESWNHRAVETGKAP